MGSLVRKRIAFCGALFLCSALLASCSERAQMPGRSFEGTIVEVIQVPGVADMMNAATNADSGSPAVGTAASMMGAISNMQVKMAVKNGKVATDVILLGGLLDLKSIIDRDARTLTTLLPNHTAMVSNLRSFDSIRGKVDDSLRINSSALDSFARLLPEPTGEKETIEGVEAERYHATNGTFDIDMWLSSDDRVKAFDIIRDAFLGRRQTGMGGMEQVFDMLRPIAGKVPVRFETRMNGKTFAKGELKKIEETTLPDELFQIPKGYSILNADSARAEHQAHRAQERERTGDWETDTTGAVPESHHVTAP